MTSSVPQYPGFEAAADQPWVGRAQAALDATFNAYQEGDTDDPESFLRAALDRAAVVDAPQGWVERMAEHIRAGEPVVAEPRDEQTP